MMGLNGMLICDNYNTLSRSNASYLLIFKLWDVRNTPQGVLVVKWPLRHFKLKADGLFSSP
jgi:hypothetical protein